MTIFDAINLAGGIALFLYGMSIMGSGLEKIASGKMQTVLQKLISSPVLGVLLGTLITGVLQSSAATIVIVIGLVNSGIMGLSQAVGVIMGANIGTTVTGQIIRMADISGDSFWMQAINPTTFAPIVAFAGAILYVFFKSPGRRNVGQIMLGFGILFTGMFMMETAVAPLKDSEFFIRVFTALQNPLLGLLAGLAATVAIQSSSASVGILQALSDTGVVTFGNAVPIVLGTHIGTCFTPMLAAIGASKGAKRSAMIHLYFNIISTAFFMVVIYGVKAVFGIPFWDALMTKGSIANLHTATSIIATLLLLPFSKFLVWLSELTIPDEKTEDADAEMPVLDERLFQSPAVAVQQAKAAVETMARNARKNYEMCVPLLFEYSEDAVHRMNRRETVIDKLEVSISNYLVQITNKSLSVTESRKVNELINYVVEFERIGDYAVNVMERAQEMHDKEILFSAGAKKELLLVHEALCEILGITYSAFEGGDVHVAERVEPLEETIDSMIESLRERHVERLKQGVCAIESGVIFLEILTNLERISDHCSNIAARIVGSEEDYDHFDAHALRRNMHDGFVPNFNEMLAAYRQKYYQPLCDLSVTKG